MVLLNSSIGSEEVFPSDYRIFNIDDNIKLICGDITKFLKVNNRNKIPFIQKYDNTNWLLSSGGHYNAGDISKWLEPQDNELMILAMSLYSDRNIDVKVKFPSSDQRFGIKKETDISITPEISPWKEPTVTLYSWGTTYIPAFDITNNTEYKNLCLKIGISGYRYATETLSVEPERYSIINLNLVR